MIMTLENGKETVREKILLHACCAVCLAYPIKILKNIYEPIVYFCNPNIFPLEEYNRRKNELTYYCEKMGYEYIAENDNPAEWQAFIKGLELEPEKGLRCDKCFEFRLNKTAQKAQELGIKYFTTTLSVSPHKVSKNIFLAGEKAAGWQNKNIQETSSINKLEFVAQDFKKQNGFLKTMEIAKENNFYRQNYCGCKYSIRN